MTFESVEAFIRSRPDVPPGIVGIVFVDPLENLDATVHHLARIGVSSLILIGDLETTGRFTVPAYHIAGRHAGTQVPASMNRFIDFFDDRWLLWQWTGEFFLFPYFETRLLADFTNFLRDERRRMAYSYTFDLYARDMPGRQDDPIDAEVYFDRVGYYSFVNEERQLSIYGGPGWRFDECCNPRMKQLGRTSLFRAKSGTYVGRDGRFEDPEFSSISCPWHNSPTAAMMSLRHVRSIVAHPGFTRHADSLIWAGSERFEWSSLQLLDHGMIEPGQWF